MASSPFISVFAVWNKFQEKFSSTASSSCTFDVPKLKQLNDMVYEVHSPQPWEKPEVEVVFFHGLQVRRSEDAYVTTWMTRDNNQLWLRTWLVELFPKARIFTVSYDSSAERTHDSGRPDMYCTVENLVSSLTADKVRIGQAGCPVVLVGHCLGGLVLKELCLHAASMLGRKSAESFGVQRVDDLFRNLRGMFFYATPHTGSIVGDELHDYFKGALLEEMKTMKASSARINEEFGDLKRKYAWLTYGIGELYETYVECLGKRIHMVPEASTRPYMDTYYSAPADHYNVCKPERKEDSALIHLQDFLKKIQNDGVLRARATTECQSSREYVVDLEGRTNQVRSMLDRPDTRTIFIVGRSGIGKTTLAQQVFHDISHSFSVACFVSLDTIDAPSKSNCREQVLRKIQDALEGFSKGSNQSLSSVLSHLKGRKVLIVLDNVEFEDQLKALVAESWLEGSASKLIVTTTNARLGTSSNTVQVPYLNDVESRAFSVVSKIITFGDVGWRIIKRVNEFVNDTGDVPEVLADIKAQLPLLIEKMDQLKSLGEERLQKIEPQSALAEAVTGCRSHIDRLENLVNKLQPQVTDSRTKKMKKAGQSMIYEDEISKILIKLEGYKTSFILHFTDISIDLYKVTKQDESYHMFPCLQVSDYVERIDLLESVKSAVQQRREEQQRQVVVLLGMGGQGKSQLAMEYCRTAKLSKEFRAIFWIDASSIKSVHRSFERIASKVADPSRIFENTEEKVAFVKDTMDGWETRWLLVFDNYDDPSTDFNVAAFFPSSPFGTILVTSRHEDSKRLGKVIPLAKMTEQESLLLLLRRSENKMTDENMATGKSIVAKLGFLPLAIDQAGAFISEQKLPLTQFLERFDLQKEDILKYTHSLTEYKRILGDDVKETALNVFTTWELSFQQIQKGERGERLRSFLTTAAFFNTRDIGEDLFHSTNDLETVPIWINAFISEGEWDSLRYQKVLAELSKLSLLNFAVEDTKQCRFYLHPLIADWLRLRVSPEIRRLCTIKSCYLLAKLIENTDLQSCGYAFHLYLLGHVDECLNNKRMYSKPVDADAGFAKIVTAEFGKLLRETSRYREGISLIEEALPIIETAYGKHHASTLITVNNLGQLYSDQGKFAGAEELYKRALAGKENAFGKDHALTLPTVDYLGQLYKKQGKFAEAEELYKRALAGKEKAFGKDHASTLSTVNNLGLLYSDQGKLAEAEELYKRALAGKEKAFGKDHASTLSTVNNLGLLYSDQGKLAEAEELYKRALAGKEKALGKDHAATLTTVQNLGCLYYEQGKLAEAEELYKRALAGKEKAFGKDHALTLPTVDYLGQLYKKQGKLAEAEELYKRALAGKEKVLGKDHASTLSTVNNLGLLYSDQGKLAEAEELYKRALAGKEKAFGKDHASTLSTVNNLGLLYSDQGKLAEAEELYKRALAGKEKALGKDHAATLTTVQNLGCLYYEQGKLAEAEELYKRALAGKEKVLGKDHASTLSTVNNLGQLYSDQGKFAEAEELYKRALAGYEKALGKDHALTLTTVDNLGQLYSKEGKFAEQKKCASVLWEETKRLLGKTMHRLSLLSTIFASCTLSKGSSQKE